MVPSLRDNTLGIQGHLLKFGIWNANNRSRAAPQEVFGCLNICGNICLYRVLVCHKLMFVVILTVKFEDKSYGLKPHDMKPNVRYTYISGTPVSDR